MGVYPAISLKESRKRREEAKEQIALGIRPGANRKALKEAVRAEAVNSFEVVAREWHDKQKDTWVKSHGDKIFARFVNDIFPIIGAKPIGSVTAPELLEALRRIEARGAVETAHRTLQNCGQIFRYAIATGCAERDPAADLRGALSPIKHTSFASIMEPKEISALLRDIDAYQGNLIVCAALRMTPYVFLRPGELRRAERE